MALNSLVQQVWITNAAACCIPVMRSSPAMDPATALRLVREYGTIVCADVPLNTEFGLDMMSWRTGPRFRGIKMVPPGIHLLYYAAEEGASRSGRFIHVERGQTVVLQWDAVAEQFRADAAVDEHTASSLMAAVRSLELDAYLGAYPLDRWEEWVRLTSFIDPGVADRIAPVGGTFLPESSSGSDDARRVMAGAASDPTAQTQSRTHFTPLRGCGRGSTPADRTAYAMDTSAALGSALAAVVPPLNGGSGDGALPSPLLSGSLLSREASLLGELQAAFVLFLMAQSLAAMDAWKRLVDVVCRAEDAMLAAASAGAAAATGTYGVGAPPRPPSAQIFSAAFASGQRTMFASTSSSFTVSGFTSPMIFCTCLT